MMKHSPILSTHPLGTSPASTQMKLPVNNSLGVDALLHHRAIDTDAAIQYYHERLNPNNTTQSFAM